MEAILPCQRSNRGRKKFWARDCPTWRKILNQALLACPSSPPEGCWEGFFFTNIENQKNFPKWKETSVQPSQLHQPHDFWERRQVLHNLAISGEIAFQASLKQFHHKVDLTGSLHHRMSQNKFHLTNTFDPFCLQVVEKIWRVEVLCAAPEDDRLIRNVIEQLEHLVPEYHALICLFKKIYSCHHHLASLPHDSRGGISKGFAQALAGWARLDTKSLKLGNVLNILSCVFWTSSQMVGAHLSPSLFVLPAMSARISRSNLDVSAPLTCSWMHQKKTLYL